MADETKQKKPRAKLAPKPPKSVQELVLHALATAATKPNASWKGATPAALFSTKEDNHEAAIAECTKANEPLLTQAGKTGALTATGFVRLLELSPPAEVVARVNGYAATLPAAGREELRSALNRRTSGPNAEVFSAALSALDAEAERAANERAKRAAQSELQRSRDSLALHRSAVARLERERAMHQAMIDGLVVTVAKMEAAIEAPDATADDEPPATLPQPNAKPATKSTGTAPEPRTDEEKDFRRYTAERLASAWRDAWDEKKDEGRDYLETAIWNIRGMKMIGEAGAKVAFDGRLHECGAPVFTNGAVRVVRPGWLLKVDDEDYVALKAAVEKA